MFILLLILVFLVVNFILVLKIRLDSKKEQEKIRLIEERTETIIEYWSCFEAFLDDLVEGEEE